MPDAPTPTMPAPAPAPSSPPPSAPVATAVADRKPDAILFPTGWEPPVRRGDVGRTHRLCLHFEAILGAGPDQKAHIRDVGPGHWLVTLDRHDTLLYPDSHPRAKFPRYDWRDGGDGLQFGYLKPDEAR